MIFSLPGLISLAAIAVLVWIVRVDFRTLKITNRSVLVLLVLYLLWIAASGFGTIWTDVFSGAILFLMALVMWLLRTMGAGDVKLYAVIGMFVGIDHLLSYALLLMLVSVAFVGVIALVGRGKGQGAFVRRMREIKTSGKAPYAIPICFAAIPMIALRNFV